MADCCDSTSTTLYTPALGSPQLPRFFVLHFPSAVLLLLQNWPARALSHDSRVSWTELGPALKHCVSVRFSDQDIKKFGAAKKNLQILRILECRMPPVRARGLGGAGGA